MAKFDQWLDQKLQWLCDALALGTAPNGGVARLGYAFAGAGGDPHLPVERLDSHREHAGKKSDGGGWAPLGSPQAPGAGGGDAHEEPDADALVEEAGGSGICAQTQYCNIYGRPCACCGGSDSSCPTGTNKGFYWTGSCGGRLIWFTDCCASVANACPATCPFCKNSAGGQPSWCAAAGPRYWCTLSEDKGSTSGSMPGPGS